MTRYVQAIENKDGWCDWFEPRQPTGYKIACCACGLVHRMEFRIKDGLVQIRAGLDLRATSQNRRHMKARVAL